MPRFAYRAVDALGAVRRGALEAPSPSDVAANLAQQGWTALEVVGKRSWFAGAWYRRLTHRKTLSDKDLLDLTQQLAALLKAGLTIDRALSTTVDLFPRPQVRALLARVLSSVREGNTFADALAQYAEPPEHYISMVRSGEIGGALPDVMVRMEDFLARSAQFKSRVHSALIYPVILLGMISCTFLIVIFVVLPRFERLFAEAGTQLPLPTRLVIALGHLVADYGVLLVVVMLATVGGIQYALKQPAIRLKVHEYLLTARWTLGLIASIESARFLRTLATLISNGVALPAAMRIARGSLSNDALRAATADVLKRLREGESLAVRLAHTRLFPQIAIRLVQVGEETGRLGPMMADAAEILERDAQRLLERLLAILVPLITILMGALVAGLVASVLVGILSLNDLAI